MPKRGRRHGAGALQRRGALLRAGMELAGERGMAGVTHRAVAERADVSLATTSYFFASLDDLLMEATRHFVAERAAELQAQAAELATASPRDFGANFARALNTGEHVRALAQIEAYLYAARHPDARPVVSEALTNYTAVAETTLATMGFSRACDRARAFVALSDGFSLHRLADPQPGDSELLAAALTALATAFALGEDELAQLAERVADRPIPA